MLELLLSTYLTLLFESISVAPAALLELRPTEQLCKPQVARYLPTLYKWIREGVPLYTGAPNAQASVRRNTVGAYPTICGLTGWKVAHPG